MDFATVFIFMLIIILLVEIFVYHFTDMGQDKMPAKDAKPFRKKITRNTIHKQTRSRGIHKLRKI